MAPFQEAFQEDVDASVVSSSVAVDEQPLTDDLICNKDKAQECKRKMWGFFFGGCGGGGGMEMCITSNKLLYFDS